MSQNLEEENKPWYNNIKKFEVIEGNWNTLIENLKMYKEKDKYDYLNQQELKAAGITKEDLNYKERIMENSMKLPSHFQINENAKTRLSNGGQEIKVKVVGVNFTESKVYYNLETEFAILENIDSALVF